MQQNYCLKQEDLREAQGAFLLAQKLGLLEDPSWEGLEKRRQEHNKMLQTMEQENKRFYGPRYFSAPAYLQYELTRLKLDCVRTLRSRKKKLFTNKTWICLDGIMGTFSHMKK